MEKILQITQHAYQRGWERLRLRKKPIYNLAEKALSKGLPYEQTKGQLHKYIDTFCLKKSNANNCRIYGEVMYLFRNQLLITLYQLPSDLRRYIKC